MKSADNKMKKSILTTLLAATVILTGCSVINSQPIPPPSERPTQTPEVKHYTLSDIGSFISVDSEEDIWRPTKYDTSLVCKNTKEDTDTEVWFVMHTEPITTSERPEVPNSLLEIGAALVDKIQDAANFKKSFSSRANSAVAFEEKEINGKEMLKESGWMETTYLDGKTEKIQYSAYYFQYDENTIGAIAMLVFGKEDENGEIEFDEEQIEKKSDMLDNMIATLRPADFS